MFDGIVRNVQFAKNWRLALHIKTGRLIKVESKVNVH